MAADEFSNHCCNDIPREWFEDWSQDELTELDKKICEFNNSPDEYVPECPSYGFDFVLYWYFSKVFKNTID